MRVGRRAAGPTGREPFVPIHTPPKVARDPLPGVYRDVRDSRNILPYCAKGSVGKGLMILINMMMIVSVDERIVKIDEIRKTVATVAHDRRHSTVRGVTGRGHNGPSVPPSHTIIR